MWSPDEQQTTQLTYKAGFDPTTKLDPFFAGMHTVRSPPPAPLVQHELYVRAVSARAGQRQPAIVFAAACAFAGGNLRLCVRISASPSPRVLSGALPW